MIIRSGRESDYDNALVLWGHGPKSYNWFWA